MQSAPARPAALAPPTPRGRSFVLTHFTLQPDRPPHFGEVDLTEVGPALRMLLFTDGTVTRTLEAQTLSPVTVDVVSQSRLPVPASVAPHLALASGMEVVRRRVRIGVGEHSAPVIWAESHMVPSRLPSDFLNALDDASDGIGGSVQQVQLESWRQMLWFGFDRVPEWSGEESGSSQMAICRLYRMIAGGKPVLVISETFTVTRHEGEYHLDLPVDQTDPNSSSIS
jgi:chorismate-pyruvate lyase